MSLTLLDLSEAKANIANVRAQNTMTLADPAAWTETFLSVKTASGQYVSREKAIRCSGVLAGIRILQEDVGTVPLILKRKEKGGAADAIDDPRYKVLKSRPNRYQTPLELREHMVLDTLLNGKFFNYVQRDSRQRPIAITPIDASTMTYGGMTPSGRLYWNCGDPNYPGVTRFYDDELWRGTMFNTNLIDGRSIILLAREAIGLAIAAEEQGARLFSQGVQTDLVIEAEGTIEDKESVRDSLARRHAGSHNAWSPMLLEGGIKAKRIGLTAQESQYIEARSFQISDIARLLRISPILYGINDKAATYASASEFFLAHKNLTIAPWCVRFEQTADRDLILPSEDDLFTKHKLSALLRADMGARMSAYKTAIESGIMQLSQAREEEDWDDIPGLHITWRPSNFVAVDENGKTIPDTAPNDAKYPATPPATGKDPVKPPQTPAQTGRLAASIAASLLKSELGAFARMNHKTEVSEARAANFAAWHVERVQELTGASGPKALAYSEWRYANQDAEEEARQRLVNLCLEGE